MKYIISSYDYIAKNKNIEAIVEIGEVKATQLRIQQKYRNNAFTIILTELM